MSPLAAARLAPLVAPIAVSVLAGAVVSTAHAEPGDGEVADRPEVHLVRGAFEVLLPERANPDAAGWLWLASGRLEGDGRPQPVPARRAWPVELRACGAGVASALGGDAGCARVTGLDGLASAPGRYAVRLHFGPDPAQALDLTLYAAPGRLTLWGALLAGLALSFTATTLARRALERRRRLRRLDRLVARLGASREDHPPLLARIEGLLGLVRIGLRRRGLGADPAALDRYLDEAEQLLRLAEAKTRVWQRARALLVPPSLAARINAELRLVDDELLQLDLPLPPDRLDELRLPALERAEALLEGASPNFVRDLGGALADALAVDDGRPPPLAADGGAETAAGVLGGHAAWERARLERLAAVPEAQRSPLQLREADMRLTALHACREALARGPDALEALDLRLVAEALKAWRAEQDLTQAAADRALEDVLYALRWQPENARFQRWLEAFLERGELRVAAEGAWQTFAPCPLRVELAAPAGTRYAETFVWRRLLEVAWRATDDAGRPTADLTVIGRRDEDGWTVARGPETSAFCTRAGRYRLEARIRPPEGGPWRPVVAPRDVRVEPGPEHRLSVVLSRLSNVELSVKLLATLLVGLLLIEEARRDPQGLSTWTGLFYAVMGATIDLGTTALPRGLEAATTVLRALFKGRGDPAPR